MPILLVPPFSSHELGALLADSDFVMFRAWWDNMCCYYRVILCIHTNRFYHVGTRQNIHINHDFGLCFSVVTCLSYILLCDAKCGVCLLNEGKSSNWSDALGGKSTDVIFFIMEPFSCSCLSRS
jgi:hypothetical protein